MSHVATQWSARTTAAPHARLPLEQKRRIYVGEVVASTTPLLLQTLLGSCVAVCLRDPVAGVGEMNHILVPGRCDGHDRPSRWGVHAMELLINSIMNQGGDWRRLVAKVFGAANVLPGVAFIHFAIVVYRL
jgi:chemotaxis receptor (MCP) glutamine deamidase CheD